jgi:hypothetical protein
MTVIVNEGLKVMKIWYLYEGFQMKYLYICCSLMYDLYK